MSELKSVRVIQRTLIYVIGLSPNIAQEPILSSEAYFGQYGSIKKIAVNRSNPYNSPSGLSFSAYINFTSEVSAILCVRAITGFTLHGREMSATFGTTKYCTSFLKNQKCHKPGCLYLHELGSKIDSFTREDIQHNKHIQAHNSIFPLLKVNVVSPPPGHVLPQAFVQRPRYFSEDLPQTFTVKDRLYSVDSPPQNSRFGFFLYEEGEEQGSETPKYLEDLINKNSPAKMEAKAKEVAELMKDAWVTDVLVFEKQTEGFLIRAA